MDRSAGILVVALLVGCADAPRDNPLDPLSAGYSTDASLSGTVVVKNQGTPVPSARIQIPAAGIFVLSDSLGKFSCARLTPGQRLVVCTKDNFTPDSQRVTVSARGTGSVTFLLNGAPVVLSQKILTRKIDQYYPSPQYYVDVWADVTDPNGITDLDSVSFCAGGLEFAMSYNPTSKMFETRVFKYDLPTNTIQWLVGKPLTILSKDRSRAANVGEPFYVLRVIETAPTPVSPSSVRNDTTDGTPLFTWQSPSVSYVYTNTVTVSRVDEGTTTVVWEAAGLNAVAETYQYPQDGSAPPLTTGTYAWAVTLVDEFGNSCRSKESTFAVR